MTKIVANLFVQEFNSQLDARVSLKKSINYGTVDNEEFYIQVQTSSGQLDLNQQQAELVFNLMSLGLFKEKKRG